MQSTMFSLQDKVAIVTGAAKGIGAAICKRFVVAGARVYGLDLDDKSGFELQSELQNTGVFQFIHCDVSKPEAVNQAFDQVLQAENRLDILINNAGISHIGNLEQTEESDFDRLYRVNVKSVYHCLQAAIPAMKRTGGGSIVNMASVASVVGLADRFAYTMSKGAVYSMTFSIAKDYLKDHIRCNAVGPARVHTPFVDDYLTRNYPGQESEMFARLAATQPIGRMGETDEVAAIVHYLCSDEAGFVTGSFYPIDGGFLRLNT